jgi:hypothetical protein
MTIFKFKDGAHINGDAQIVGERLSALEAKGALTPEGVLRDARSTRSVLHPFFEWDDAIAAEKHRLQQAGHLIRCVTVVLDDHEADAPRTIRAFVPISGDDEHRSYVPMMKALGDADMRRQVLAQAHAELGAVAKRYRELKELSEVVQAIDRVGELLHSSEGQQS